MRKKKEKKTQCSESSSVNSAEKKAKKELKREKSKESSKKSLSGSLFAKMARGGAAELRTNADEVNRLNVFPVPDGDTGDNMRMTIESGIAAIENLNSDNLAEVMRVLSHGMLLGARGNSGVILSQFFAGVADGFKNANEADPYSLGEALKLGVKKAYGTVMTPIEGTILTVAREAVDYAVSKITPQTTIKSFFANLSREMYASLERTPEILPALKSAGVVDSGGAGLFYIVDGFRRVLNGENIAEITDNSDKKAVEMNTDTLTPDTEMPLPYCTEVLLQLLNAKSKVEDFRLEDFKTYISMLGDSVCTVMSGSTVKLHVHSFTPEKVIEYARSFGELISVKIENMNLQHSDTTSDVLNNKKVENYAKGKQSFTETEINREKQKKKYSVVTVSCGTGFQDLFYKLGADAVIYDENGKAPSAREFLNAFLTCSGEEIFVLPNDSNIILSARQAAQLYTGAGVYVIETKSVCEGYAAITAYEGDENSVEAVTKAMREAISDISDGSVFYAVRNAEIDGVKIKKGDTVGTVDKKIIISSKSDAEACDAVAAELLQQKRLLTVFYGKMVTKKDYEKLISRLKALHPDKEVYSYFGGQEIYPYIFAAK